MSPSTRWSACRDNLSLSDAVKARWTIVEPTYWGVVQLVARLTLDQKVLGSSPSAPVIQAAVVNTLTETKTATTRLVIAV